MIIGYLEEHRQRMWLAYDAISRQVEQHGFRGVDDFLERSGFYDAVPVEVVRRAFSGENERGEEVVELIMEELRAGEAFGSTFKGSYIWVDNCNSVFEMGLKLNSITNG